MHTIAAKAVCFREALQPSFKQYAGQVVANARTLAEGLARAGFRLISSGTDNHFVLVDVTVMGQLAGRTAQCALDRAGLCVNQCMIPFDPRKPMDPSGIRVGTPAATTRGMKDREMKQIANWITRVLAAPADQDLQEKIRLQVREFCQHFPVPTAAVARPTHHARPAN
jgi:glycine hydroxymethyltransferase